MAGILDDLMGAVNTVAAVAAPPPAGSLPTAQPAPVEDRLGALENFVGTWGPVLEKLAPMLEKLANL
jgi:hypothetical protein